jgi:hypothetical protein
MKAMAWKAPRGPHATPCSSRKARSTLPLRLYPHYEYSRAFVFLRLRWDLPLFIANERKAVETAEIGRVMRLRGKVTSRSNSANVCYRDHKCSGRMIYESPLCPKSRQLIAQRNDANGMDRPRSYPNGSQSAWGACQEQEHDHASQVHRSSSDRHRNRYGQDHTSHGGP